jgi:hypothetical protein
VCESGCLERVCDGGGATSLVQFRLERGDDGMKHCRKMKRSSELLLAPWKGSMIWCDDVMTSAGGDAAPGRGNGGDDTS